MERVWIRISIGFLMSALACSSVWAQAIAEISGVVRDQSGAVLPGVEVTATQTDTGVARSSITNETGSYTLPNLAVGPYRLEAVLPGFRTFVQTGIVLQVNSNPVINPILQVGEVTEQVEVQANAALVETRSTAVGQVIENARILELPLNGRQVTDLITLSGAAVQTGSSNQRNSWAGGVLISIAGGQSFGVMYSLDGALHNNVYDGTQFPMPFPDALQEFKVDASGFSAAGGTRGSGGQVNAVTKSGTNEFHGNVFEFVRNYAFNARNFFAPERDSLKRNQYGGTLGGPIVKNKLFFFGGYQGTKTRAGGDPVIQYVPTAAMLAGDFTTFASAACNAGRPIALKAPFVNNRIDPALFSKAAMNLAAKLPKAQDDCGKFIYGVAVNQDEWQTVSKVDYQWTAKHSIFGRFLATKLAYPHPFNTTQKGNLLVTTADLPGKNDLATSYSIGSTYLVSPNTINSFRLTVNRTALGRNGASFFSASDIGVKNYSYVPDAMLLSVSGGFSIGNRSKSGHKTTAIQIGDDITISKGTHQMTFGANWANWKTVSRTMGSDDAGNFNFNGSVTGLGMGDFFTGKLTTLSLKMPTVQTGYQWYLASYAADVWKATQRLTVNYGVRWEPLLPLAIGHGQGPTLNEGAMYHFSDQRFSNGVRSSIYPTGPAGLIYPGDPGFPSNGKPIYTKWALFAPRAGLAWDVKGDGRTSVRASYGMAYDFSGSVTLGGSSSAPPYGFSGSVQSPAGGFEDPWRDYPGGDPFPYDRKNPRFPYYSSYYFIQKFDSSIPTVQSWNLSIQRQVPGDFLVSANYLGSHTTHLWVEGNINRAIYFPSSPVNGVCTVGGLTLRATGTACSTTGNTNDRRRLFLQNPQEGQYYGNLATREDSGTQSYHGLLLSVQRRASTGVNVGGNYTWSHCLGNAPTANATGTGGGGYLDPNNRDFDRGNCEGDRRHIFNVTTVASTPQFANPTMRAVASGWRASGIYRWSTGSYLTLTTGLDRALSGFAGNQRPNQILGDPYGDRNSVTRYLNAAAFAQPDLGTIGNMRRANIVSPGFFQLDVSLSRLFQVREGQNLEVRAEAFNLTNSLRMGTPTTALNSNTFGQITTAADARVMQFALKYSF